MKIFWLILTWLTVNYMPIYSHLPSSCPVHTLYLAHIGKIKECIEAYQNYFNVHKKHDMDFLQQLGLCLLEQGWQAKDPETQLMALYGAGISINDKASALLAQALATAHPKLQLIALNFLTRWQDEDTERHLSIALRSNYMLIRLQAIAQMAKQRLRQAASHLESLMAKLDPELHVVFPQLLAAINDKSSQLMLKRLLNSASQDVRIEAIRHAAKIQGDDFLAKIRSMATHGTLGELEACAYAFSVFKDELSVPRLKVLVNSAIPTVRLAALQALYTLGRKEYGPCIMAMAQEGDLFAICALKDVAGTEDLLKKLLSCSDLQIQLNAALTLLEKRAAACVGFLPHILIVDPRDLAFTVQASPGRTLNCWKVIPSAKQNFDASSPELEQSLALREDVLAKTIDLPQEAFLTIITKILQTRQNDLVPLATQLLEQDQSPRAIELLKTFQQCMGGPLIRNYCNLALCRLGEEGPYKQALQAWAQAAAGESFIQLRPFTPWNRDDPLAMHQITAEESSRLLLETFQYFAEKQDDEGIHFLLNAIKNGHAQNKYALAGLLIRAAM